jgi:TatD DNase family protein
MIDTHAHLQTTPFDADREPALARAFAAGLEAIIEVNIDAAGWPRALAVAERDPRVFLTVGIHPHDTGRAAPEDLDRLAGNIWHPRVRAVGETGLDYFRDYAPAELQRDFFRRHVALARESRLPLVVHARTGPDGPPVYADIFRILAEEGRGRVRGVLHCFSGGLVEARAAVALGFRLGIGGAITYRPRESGPLLAALAAELGPEVFVLETDCPWLPPQPHRGKRSEPAFVPLVAAALAGYLGVTSAEVERITDTTARDLFRLPGASGAAGTAGET